MSFWTTFLPVLGIACGLFVAGLLWLIYRFLSCVLTGLLKR